MSTDLLALQKALSVTLGQTFRTHEGWGDPQAMQRTLAEVLLRHDNPVERVDDTTIENSIIAFRTTRKFDGFRDLKYVCLGAADAIGGRRVLADKRLRETLLEAAQAGNPRRRMKCFQSLLRSYWKFPLNDEEHTKLDKEGWDDLRTWLLQRRSELEREKMRVPSWFKVLYQHANLLGERPCERYGKALLQGDGSLLNEAVQGLAIPRESWVLEEAVFAQMKAGANLGEAAFQDTLPQLLAIATGNTGIVVSKSLATRCLAILVARYSGCRSKPEHLALRDASIAAIGNPWLRRAAWDAHVLNDQGKPHHEAREMVNSWLRRRLIRDFFELLSEDGAADSRRLNYWLRFEPMIEGMWFALGSRATNRKGADFHDFRVRAKGLCFNLSQTVAENNAFIMRMGDFVVVEFGIKGNACFLFKWNALPPQLAAYLANPQEGSSVSIHNLKVRKNEDRKVHNSSGGQSWEQRFDEWICPLLGSRPSEKPFKLSGAQERTVSPRESVAKPIVETPKSSAFDRIRKTAGLTVDSVPVFRFSESVFNNLVRSHDLQCEDNRHNSGALWVKEINLDTTVIQQLKRWGFRQKAGRGWWKE